MPPPPLPALSGITSPASGLSLESSAGFAAAKSTPTVGGPGGASPPSVYGLPPLAPFQGAPGLAQTMGKGGTATQSSVPVIPPPQSSIPTPPPLPPPPKSSVFTPPPPPVGMGSTSPASMPFTGSQMMGAGGGLGGLPAYAGGLDPRLCELPKPISYEQEKREHEQAITLAALTRSVLALARSTAAASASASGGADGDGANAPVAVKESATAGAVLGKLTPPAVVTTPAATGTPSRAVGAATRAAEDGEEAGAGVAGPAVESDPEGGERLAAAMVAAVAADEAEAEIIPSEESLYLEAMEEQQFATMQMEVASPLTSTESAAGGGGGGELLSFRTVQQEDHAGGDWARVRKRAGAR